MIYFHCRPKAKADSHGTQKVIRENMLYRIHKTENIPRKSEVTISAVDGDHSLTPGN